MEKRKCCNEEEKCKENKPRFKVKTMRKDLKGKSPIGDHHFFEMGPMQHQSSPKEASNYYLEKAKTQGRTDMGHSNRRIFTHFVESLSARLLPNSWISG